LNSSLKLSVTVKILYLILIFTFTFEGYVSADKLSYWFGVIVKIEALIQGQNLRKCLNLKYSIKFSG